MREGIATTSCSAMTIWQAISPRDDFGATVGRYANRIANARFALEGCVVQLAANNGAHALHGGLQGFDRQLWQIAEIENGAKPGATLAYVSADGEEGYPGRLDVRVSYRLTGPSELSVSFAARADRPTIVNLTNHSFFNLEGAASPADVLEHRLTVAADRFLAIDPDAIPLPGPPRIVAGTLFDFERLPRSARESATTMRSCGTAAATTTISAWMAPAKCGSPHGLRRHARDESSNS